MEQNISSSLILTKDQADYLSASKQGINRMQALVSLINLTRTAEEAYEKKGFAATVHVGQFVASEVELSHLWKCDRKTVSRVLDQMNQVGLVSTVQNNRTSVHTVYCIKNWRFENRTVYNKFYEKQMKKGNQ